MVEDEMIKKYSKYLIGFAYEIFAYEIDTYLVIKKEDKLEYVFYKYYEFGSPKRKNEILENLCSEGYKELNFYKEEFEKKLKLKK